MKRLAVLAVLAALLSSTGAASTGGAQAAGVSITVIDAYTYDYPSAPAPLTVCLDGQNPQVLEVGDPYFIEGSPGLYKFTIFFNDSAACSDVPDTTFEVETEAGDDLGFVIGESSTYTFDYDRSCVGAGEARVLIASGIVFDSDVYLYSQADGQYTKLATGLFPGSAPTSEQPAGTYDVVVVETGNDPDGPRLTTLPNINFTEGTSTQVFLAGGSDGAIGGFLSQQGPDVCDEAEPPPEEATTSTTSTSSTTTTTTPAVAPESATPATAVTSTPTYTG